MPSLSPWKSEQSDKFCTGYSNSQILVGRKATAKVVDKGKSLLVAWSFYAITVPASLLSEGSRWTPFGHPRAKFFNLQTEIRRMKSTGVVPRLAWWPLHKFCAILLCKLIQNTALDNWSITVALSFVWKCIISSWISYRNCCAPLAKEGQKRNTPRRGESPHTHTPAP